MPVPIAIGIGTVLSAIVVPLVVKVLASFGLGFVTYTGINLLLDGLGSQIEAQFNSITLSGVQELLAYLNVDTAVTMLLSAIVVRATLRGLSAGGDLRKLGSVI